MTENEITQAMVREMATKGGLEFHFSPASTLRAVALMQLAARHPHLDESHRLFVRTFIEHVRAYFADCPTVLEVIRRGDDPRQDEPTKGVLRFDPHTGHGGVVATSLSDPTDAVTLLPGSFRARNASDDEPNGGAR